MPTGGEKAFDFDGIGPVCRVQHAWVEEEHSFTFVEMMPVRHQPTVPEIVDIPIPRDNMWSKVV